MWRKQSTTEGFPVQEECALSLVWRISQCRFGDELLGRASGGEGVLGRQGMNQTAAGAGMGRMGWILKQFQRETRHDLATNWIRQEM